MSVDPCVLVGEAPEGDAVEAVLAGEGGEDAVVDEGLDLQLHRRRGGHGTANGTRIILGSFLARSARAPSEARTGFASLSPQPHSPTPAHNSSAAIPSASAN